MIVMEGFCVLSTVVYLNHVPKNENRGQGSCCSALQLRLEHQVLRSTRTVCFYLTYFILLIFINYQNLTVEMC